MAKTLAFDVYGTLIDTHGVVAELQLMIGERARAFSVTWREKQLEYAFRRGLMQHYADFAICTRDALAYTDALYGTGLGETRQQQLLACYGRLPAFDDAMPALAQLAEAGHRLYAFSNGSRDTVCQLLEEAGLCGYLKDVVSVESLRSFKPNPAVYSHFLRCAGVTAGDAWLVSSNAFDVIGARSAGLRAAWIRRDEGQVFDPWGIEPTVALPGLLGLAGALDPGGQ